MYILFFIAKEERSCLFILPEQNFNVGFSAFYGKHLFNKIYTILNCRLPNLCFRALFNAKNPNNLLKLCGCFRTKLKYWGAYAPFYQVVIIIVIIILELHLIIFILFKRMV